MLQYACVQQGWPHPVPKSQLGSSDLHLLICVHVGAAADGVNVMAETLPLPDMTLFTETPWS